MLQPLPRQIVGTEPISQQDALQLLAQQALSHTGIAALFEAIATTFKTVLGMPYCRCWQMLSDNLTLKCISVTDNLKAQQLPTSFSGAEAPWINSLKQRKQPFSLKSSHQRSPEAWTTILAPAECKTGFLIPVLGADQELLAAIELYGTESQLGSSELPFLQSVAHLLATAIQRSRSEGLLATQSKILEQLAAGDSLQNILSSLCLLIEAQSPGSLCSIMLLDESGTKMVAGAAPTFPQEWNDAIDGLTIGEGVASCGTALHRKEPVFVTDIAKDPLWAPFKAFAKQHDIHSCWSTPFFSKTGEVLGSMALSHRSACAPLQFHHQLIKTAAHLASITTESSRATAQLRHQAQRDLLTGLYNRATLLSRIEARIQAQLERPPSESFAVVFLDVDHFKLVNDSWGHSVGDQLLVAIAHRLKSCLPDSAVLARLGGDEFAILLEGYSRQSGAQGVLKRIVEQFSMPFELGDHSLFATTSVGIAYGGDRYQDPEEILRDADIAMYQAKQTLSDEKIAVFDQAMHERVMARHGLETGLRRSIQQAWHSRGAMAGEGAPMVPALELHYQPIVSLANREIVGFEALLRWQHELRGRIEPVEFIPVAEETGLIIPLGSWVLRSACEQLKLWHQQLGDESLMMSINVSGRQLLQADFVGQVGQLLAESGLPPSCIKLEMTETVLIEATAVLKARLEALRGLGVHLSLDDFGTGYSSLSYLHQFPVNTLKIDRSFVMDLQPGQDQVTRTMVGLSEGLGLTAIAEGIETEGQLAQLVEMGCGFGQGYLFSRPVDRAGAEALLLGR